MSIRRGRAGAGMKRGAARPFQQLIAACFAAMWMVAGAVRVAAETVGTDNTVYMDGQGSCQRRVTLQGEGDCFFSLKRLMSGTGIANLTAKGTFISTSGQLLKYQSATDVAQWQLEPPQRIGISAASPTHRLHVAGPVRSTVATSFVAMDQRIQSNIVAVNTTESYLAVRSLAVRDFDYHPAYVTDNLMTSQGSRTRGFTTQQVKTTLPASVSEVTGAEVFGSPTGADGVVEVDAMQLVDYQRLVTETIAAFQQLADRHDALQAQHDALQAEVTALKASVAARDAADQLDREDIRRLLSAESGLRLQNATNLKQMVDAETAQRTSEAATLRRDLAYVSRVFTTYEGN